MKKIPGLPAIVLTLLAVRLAAADSAGAHAHLGVVLQNLGERKGAIVQ